MDMETKFTEYIPIQSGLDCLSTSVWNNMTLHLLVNTNSIWNYINLFNLALKQLCAGTKLTFFQLGSLVLKVHRTSRTKVILTHTLYLSFFCTPRHFWPVNCMPEKCVNSQKKCIATKQRKSILDVLAVLVGILAVLVCILGVLCIGMVYLLHEMEH